MLTCGGEFPLRSLAATQRLQHANSQEMKLSFVYPVQRTLRLFPAGAILAGFTKDADQVEVRILRVRIDLEGKP